MISPSHLQRQLPHGLALAAFTGALIGALCALPAHAQPGRAGHGGMEAGPAIQSASKPLDCTKARNPERCQQRQKAIEACKDQPAGVDRRTCLRDQMPPPDCGKARNPERCAAMNQAREACKGKYGRDHRQCMRDNTPPPPAKP